MRQFNLEKSLEYLDRNSIPGEEWMFFDDDRLQENSIMVSSEGRVYNTRTCHFLREYGSDNSKPYVYLNQTGEKAYGIAIEDLMAICWVEKPEVEEDDEEERMVLDHLDGDITNNAASNLSWKTIGELKAMRRLVNESDYIINKFKTRLNEANRECESWQAGYWNLYFKYVPKDEQIGSEEDYRKQVKTAADIFTFAARDKKAEQNNVIDFKD